MEGFIAENITNADKLEQYYRENPSQFKTEFNLLYPRIKGTGVADFWHQRLHYEKPTASAVNKSEIWFVVIAAFLAGWVVKIPDIFHLTEDVFFQKNISFVVFPFLIAYFIWKRKLTSKKIIFPAITVLISVIYINLLPEASKSDAVFLSCIHLPILLWTLLGYAFTGRNYRGVALRIDYLKFNGDFLVMTAVIMASAMLFTAITMGLFKMINVDIQEIYFKYIALWGIASVPLVSTYLLQNNPSIVNKVSPTIVKIFTPLVTVLLFAYLIAVLYTVKDPYNDREFLLLFNILLIAVLAIIFFSIAEASSHNKKNMQLLLLLMLSFLTIIINFIALTAIGFRIMQFGFTPNRLAVLGSNLLIFVNLILVSIQLLKTVQRKNQLEHIEKSMVSYLPIYGAWAAFVLFFFPMIFGFHN